METGIVAVNAATPDALVVAEPTEIPFKLNKIVRPLTNVAPASDVRVADSDSVPPTVPLASATAKPVPCAFTANESGLLLAALRGSGSELWSPANFACTA